MVHMKQVAMLLERNSRFCHVPTVWLAVETTENMAVLNVIYSMWMRTVLVAFNSNNYQLYFQFSIKFVVIVVVIFYLNYVLQEIKTLNRQEVNFSLETKATIIQFSSLSPTAFHQSIFFGHFADFQHANGPNQLQCIQKGICS